MEFHFITTDVFTDRIFGGNPLAVLPEAGGLDETLMQTVAAEFNLSETVFVLPPEDPAHTCRLRIFTPAMELPFAGHPTVGTALVLATTGRVPLPTGDGETRIVLEEAAGPVPVTISMRDGAPVSATFTGPVAPTRGPEPPPASDLARLLGLEVGDLGDFAAPATASAGVGFVFVPIRDRAAMARISLDTGVWKDLLAGTSAPSVYAVTRDTGAPDIDLRARMFAPAMGIAEDPATGAAATALPGWLGPADSRADDALTWILEQGVEMGRPSRLEVAARRQDGRIVEVRVGGGAVMVGEGTLRLPEAGDGRGSGS